MALLYHSWDRCGIDITFGVSNHSQMMTRVSKSRACGSGTGEMYTGGCWLNLVFSIQSQIYPLECIWV